MIKNFSALILWEWLKSRNCTIISQYNLPLPRCTFSNDVLGCLSIQNRSLLPGPPSTHQQHLWCPSLLPKFLPWRLVFRCGNSYKSEAAKSGEYRGWGRTSKLHLVAAAVATRGVGWCIIAQEQNTSIPLFFTISWCSRLSYFYRTPNLFITLLLGSKHKPC